MNNAKNLYMINKAPTPYNDDLFRALNGERDINLQVYHLLKATDRRPWKTRMATGYQNYFMKTFIGVDLVTCRSALFDTKSFFMVGDWAYLPCIAIILIRIIRKLPVALWVDTPQEQLHRPIIKRVIRGAFLRFLLQKVDIIFGSGKPAKRVLQRMGAFPNRIVDLQFIADLNNPHIASKRDDVIEQSVALRKSVGCQNVGIVFCMNGTIDLKKKAQDFGIKAFAECCSRTSVPIGLLVAGSGDELTILQKVVIELGINDCVKLLGWQEPREMDAVYLASDILLHPAYYDPFPNVVLEAMCWGIPVIGSDACGSIEERVRDGINGLSFPVGHKDALVKSMMKFINNSELLNKASREALKTAETWPMSRAVSIIKDQLYRLVKE